MHAGEEDERGVWEIGQGRDEHMGMLWASQWCYRW